MFGEQLTQQDIKKRQLEMLDYFDKICQKNNIKYTLVGGSLIGAIRHKGMIPWDDDIDVAIHYNDNEKLIAAFKKENNKRFTLMNHNNNREYYYAFSKLIDNETRIIEGDNVPFNGYGVFIDVFFYYNAPNNRLAQKKYYKKIKAYNRMLGGIKKPTYGKNPLKNFLIFLRHFYIKILGANFFFDKLAKIYNKLQQRNYDSNFLLPNWSCYSLDQDLQAADMFYQIKSTKFENLNIKISTEYDKILKKTYGNYMQLPPENKRVTHNIKAYKKNIQKD